MNFLKLLFSSKNDLANTGVLDLKKDFKIIKKSNMNKVIVSKEIYDLVAHLIESEETPEGVSIPLPVCRIILIELDSYKISDMTDQLIDTYRLIRRKIKEYDTPKIEVHTDEA